MGGWLIGCLGTDRGRGNGCELYEERDCGFMPGKMVRGTLSAALWFVIVCFCRCCESSGPLGMLVGLFMVGIA